MEEWKSYKLGDISTIQTGPFGSQLHQSDYVESGVPCIMPTNIGRMLDFQVAGIAHISEGDALKLSRHIVHEGDIVYSRRGDIEKCAYVSQEQDGWFCGTGCLKITINSNLAVPKFVAYYLSTDEIKSWIVGNAVGTTMLNLNTSVLADVPLSLPSIQMQKRCVQILDSIENKIALNNRINHNLEEQAQALYKSWFVDFEPFKDGKFIDSELGMIPAGWHVGSVKDIINIQSGFPFKSESFVERGQYLLITIKAVQDGQLTISGADSVDAPLPIKMPNHCILKVGDILLSLTGNIGRVCIVDRVKLLLNQRVANLAPKEELNRAFTYFLARNDRFKDCMYQIARGTAQLNLSPVETGNLQIVIPPHDVMNRFSCVATPMFEAIITSLREMISLQSSRDSLLPQLLSGQITC